MAMCCVLFCTLFAAAQLLYTLGLLFCVRVFEWNCTAVPIRTMSIVPLG